MSEVTLARMAEEWRKRTRYGKEIGG